MDSQAIRSLCGGDPLVNDITTAQSADTKLKIIAAVSGIVGFLFFLLTPLMPVNQIQSSLHWPQGSLNSVNAPLESYAPERIDIQVPIAAIDSLREDESLLVGTLPLDSEQATSRGLFVRSFDGAHTDVWLSLGEPKELWEERIEWLRPYQVTMEMLAATGNPGVRFMHCLPAFHDRNTSIAEEVFQATGLEELEVTNEVFESDFNIAFDQSENRMHTIKALLVATLAD